MLYLRVVLENFCYLDNKNLVASSEIISEVPVFKMRPALHLKMVALGIIRQTFRLLLLSTFRRYTGFHHAVDLLSKQNHTTASQHTEALPYSIYFSRSSKIRRTLQNLHIF